MAKNRLQYICQSCGAVYPRWSGKCEACGEWNSISEEAVSSGVGANPALKATKGRAIELVALSGEMAQTPRLPTGLPELDQVTGGGLVPGSVLLVGGDPGIGKSTLLIQTAAKMAKEPGDVVYISGEEAIAQVRLRAERLGLAQAPAQLAAETALDDVIATLKTGKAPKLLIIDSIQTMWTGAVETAPGTVTQLRAVAQTLVAYAKKSGTAVILIGHVTKEGTIAGPRVVEHMVDAVLYFEGDRGHQFRILRSVKNRFGPTDEIGVFEMTGEGLREVANPSELFISERGATPPGTAVFAGMEGSRPILVEVQALAAQSPLGTPRRSVVGWDSNRLSMILAVLESRCGVVFSGQDIYLNVAGGLRLNEPAADLAVAAALVSSLTGKPLPPETVFFGEISLSGAVRPVGRVDARLKEAMKLGFERAFLPQSSLPEKPMMATSGISSLQDLSPLIAAGAKR